MARDRFSLEELAHLHSTLLTHKDVTEHNKGVVVETLRAIAELMIWGDQHEPRVFEFFLEKQLLTQFRRILSHPGAKSSDLQEQVLQTLSIMISNIRNETSIYFLFSNNQINSMISIDLDFTDEEVLGYYVSFLKAIAMKCNAQTVQLFLIMDNKDAKLPKSFPLYTEALKLFRNKESMVRAGVRTLTLSVYSIRDELVRNFILSPPASNYFRHVAMYLTEQCQLLDSTLMSAETSSSSFSCDSLDNVLAEVEDVLVYVNDVLHTACAKASAMMANSFWKHFLMPCFFAPLIRGTEPRDPTSLWVGEYQALTRPVCALYVAERVFALMNSTSLVNCLACALLGVDPRQCDPSSLWANRDLVAPDHGDSKLFRRALVSALSGSDCAVAGAAVRLLFSLLQNQILDMDLMDLAGLLPYRKRKRRDLFNSLTSSSKALARSEADHEEPQITSTMIPQNGQTTNRIHSPASLEILDGLFSLLSTPAMPASVLWYTGWILGQLVPVLQRGTHHSRVLTHEHHNWLDSARKVSHDEAMLEAAGLWGDALLMLVCAEWPAAKRGITAPSLKSHSESVLAWMTASKAKSQGDSAKLMYTKPQAKGNLSISAQAAVNCTTAVQRLVALLQIRQLLYTGQIPVRAPVPKVVDPLNVVRMHDLREGSQVDLAGPVPSAIPCRVSFSRGVERSVYFAMHGGTAAPEDTRTEAFWQSSPVVLLADPASTRFNAGTVLSTAPLLGADPAVDGSHPHWLHLHVRPPVRGLVKALKLGQGSHGVGTLLTPAGMSALGQKHLQDGHWVLSFGDGDASAHAKVVVEERAASFRAAYCELLDSLLSDHSEAEHTEDGGGGSGEHT
eukprot:CAMPEP_0117665702 /NCGR_PEP_ID=MMETSP0804-20121206/9962_1 /TAXON_ID=1074897 /ORGANISM="Tetraselmis astigmatica, Strain CCMP880" /LENGTH=845 /DNA_ID=CAMNT_0005473155 /DNA_START=342 /DNA_END=2879 /DNA_ORIENTATION=+